MVNKCNPHAKKKRLGDGDLKQDEICGQKESARREKASSSTLLSTVDRERCGHMHKSDRAGVGRVEEAGWAYQG